MPLRLLAVALLAGLVPAFSRTAPHVSDEAAVRAFLESYISASAAGDRTGLERAFWPGATVAGIIAPQARDSQELTVQSAAEFVDWMVSTRQRYQRVEFIIIRNDTRIYEHLADVRLVLEIREQEAGKPLDTLHSL